MTGLYCITLPFRGIWGCIGRQKLIKKLGGTTSEDLLTVDNALACLLHTFCACSILGQEQRAVAALGGTKATDIELGLDK